MQLPMKAARICRWIIATAFPATLPLAAEEAERSRGARFLAVGDSPPYQQVVEGGIARELEPPAGSVPPRRLSAVDPALGPGEGSSTLELRLGQITGPVAIPRGEGGVVLRKAQAAADSAPWHTVKRPVEGDFLVLLWRKPGAPTWDVPVSLSVPDGQIGAPVGSVSITNLFPADVGVQWGESYHVLKPGVSHVERLSEGSVVPFRIEGSGPSGGRKRYFSTTISRNENERTRVIIYRADGESPRRPLQVLMLREPVEPANPVPKPQ